MVSHFLDQIDSYVHRQSQNSNKGTANMAEALKKPTRTDMSPTYRRIWQFMGQFRGKIGAAIGTSLLASIAFSLLPWPIRYLIDDVLLGDKLKLGIFGQHITETRSQKIAVGSALAGGYLVIQLLAAIVMSWSFYLFAGVALRMIHSLRGRMLRHLRSLSLGFHANRSSGEMIFRSINTPSQCFTACSVSYVSVNPACLIFTVLTNTGGGASFRP